MLRNILFGSLMTIALIPIGSSAQESVTVVGPVEIKKERPLASGYEKLLATPGRIVLSKRYPLGDPSFGMSVRVSYRENTPMMKIYTLHSYGFSIDLEKIPLLISDLESFVQRMKAAEGKENEDVHFRFSTDFYLFSSSNRDDKGVLRQGLYLRPGSYLGQGEAAKKTLSTYLDGLKQGYSKLQELKRLR